MREAWRARGGRRWPVALLLVAGCAGTVTATGRVQEPAAVPVRAFPRIWLLEGELPVERELVRRLAEHLERSDKASVEIITRGQWADRRARGGVPRATVVVRLHLDVDEQMDTRWTRRPDTICDAMGCYTVNRSYPYDMPTLQAQLVVTVYAGRSAQRLQRARATTESQEGHSYDTMRERARRELAQRLEEMVDHRRRAVQVELLETDHPPVKRALALAAEGSWRKARRILERFAQRAELQQLDPSERARVLYNLGQARRFGTRAHEEPRRRLQAAQQALREAAELDDDDRYATALKAAARDLRNAELIREQRQAARYNFSLADDGITHDRR